MDIFFKIQNSIANQDLNDEVTLKIYDDVSNELKVWPALIFTIISFLVYQLSP